ncbi:MAG: serine hydrolase [Proteobacteria bacterium]|nr:serine hydrolase [Pseudomonadota bacterium]
MTGWGATVLALAGFALGGVVCAGERTALGYATLMSGDYPRPVDFPAYAPAADAQVAKQQFNGVLTLRFRGTLPHHTLLVDPAYVGPQDLELALTWPADFSYRFVQDGDALVPLRRGAIPGRHGWWEVILEPGRVWNEPGDHGLARAAIPFTLEEKNANCMHNGVLMFLFGADGTVSHTAMQIASETCRYLHVDLWAMLDTRYQRAGPAGRADAAAAASAVAAYRAERAARLPHRSLAQLASEHPEVDVGALAIGAPGASTLHGLVVGGIHYTSDCETRAGSYPYCDELDLPSYSLAKSVFAATALMRLQALHADAGAQLVSAHVPQCRGPAWQRVTFLDALDMATGNFDSAAYEADEDAAGTAGLFMPLDHASKIRYSCTVYPHRATPGTQWVYHSSDTYILGTALAHYLRHQAQYRQADLFRDLIVAQLYAPLHLSPTARVTRRTYDAVAQPFTGWGLSLKPNDVARLGMFYAVDHGAIDGQPLLDATLMEQALQRDANARGLPVAGFATLRYQHGFWARNLKAVLGCAHDTWVPFMSGFGGISVVLFPNGVVYYNFADDGQLASFDWAAPAREVRKLGDYCQ